MAQNAPNELKFGLDMYFYEFYQIPEDFENFSKLVDFWRKKGHLAHILCHNFEKKNFHGKCNNALKNA